MKRQKKSGSRLSSSIWRLNMVLNTLSVIIAVGLVMLLDDTNVLPGVVVSLFVRLLVGAAIIFIATWTSHALINRLCASLRSLSAGTKEIEKGNYKVQVENKDPNSEVGMLITNFNHMARELDNTEMFRKDFINNFSHEFKTPITSIAGFAARLQRPDVPEEKKREYVDVIVQESRRLSALSSNILMLSHYENQDAVTGREEYSLDEQLRLCVLAMQDAWSAKNLEIEADLQPLTIRANADMLAQVWNNLLSNAVKFTREGDSIRVTVTQMEAAPGQLCKYRLVIADTGIGMSKEYLPHLFEPYSREMRFGERQAVGTGLGMRPSAVSSRRRSRNSGMGSFSVSQR